MNSPIHKCPKCGGATFKRWQLPHPLILHWILNPGTAFNETVLGQRLPKTQLICQECDGPLWDRAYIPCPSCGEMHLGRLASGKRGFGNWRGIACPSCRQPIPCLWNVFSLLVLLLTFPLWALPYFLYFRKRPLPPLFILEDGKPPAPKALTKSTWVFMGAAWGGLMWIFMSVVPVLSGGGQASGWSSALIGLPICMLGGIAFGFLMWFLLGRTVKQPDHCQQDGVGRPAGLKEE